jgi:hypothetical protein
VIMFRKVKISDTTIAYSLLAILFLIAFGYFYRIGNYIFFFQENQSLFVYSDIYIHQFLIKPGGLLELAGKFLTQFYSDTFRGSLILALILILPGIIMIQINKRLIPGGTFSIFLTLIPSSFLLMMQAHYYHMMEYNLGFLLVLLYFLVSIISVKQNTRYLVFAFFPVFYYLTGAFVWIFTGMYCFYFLVYEKGIRRILSPLVLLGIGAISLVLFREILFFEPYTQLFLYPLPFINDPAHDLFFRIFAPFIVMYPLLFRGAGLVSLKLVTSKIFSLVSGLILLPVIIYGLSVLNNSQTARVIQLEKLVFEGEFDEAINLQEKDPSMNLIGQYFYNVALSETGQLCNRLFYGRQDFGSGSLILPWGNEHLSWGAYFYYSIGLINEAHRWAYEEMVVYGWRPQSMKLLVKTNLINGNYRMAQKYIDILKKTIYYNSWAKQYERFIDDPELIKSDPELGEKLKLLPGNIFFIQLDNPQNNISNILESNPDNRKAYEYLIAWLLLNKDVETVVNNISRMKELGYKRIPRHIEEAVLSYYNSKKVVPDLGGLTVSPETIMRFDQYVQSYMGIRQNPSSGKEMMQQKFGNTFWYYFHFK